MNQENEAPVTEFLSGSRPPQHDRNSSNSLLTDSLPTDSHFSDSFLGAPSTDRLAPGSEANLLNSLLDLDEQTEATLSSVEAACERSRQLVEAVLTERFSPDFMPSLQTKSLGDAHFATNFDLQNSIPSIEPRERLNLQCASSAEKRSQLAIYSYVTARLKKILANPNGFDEAGSSIDEDAPVLQTRDTINVDSSLRPESRRKSSIDSAVDSELKSIERSFAREVAELWNSHDIMEPLDKRNPSGGAMVHAEVNDQSIPFRMLSLPSESMDLDRAMNVLRDAASYTDSRQSTSNSNRTNGRNRGGSNRGSLCSLTETQDSTIGFTTTQNSNAEEELVPGTVLSVNWDVVKDLVAAGNMSLTG